MTQMTPQSRHYVERSLIFDHFKVHFNNLGEFTKLNGLHCCESLGAELFSKKWFVPDAFFPANPYQLKDAVSLSGLLLTVFNLLATRSAVLYHCNYGE